MEAFHAESHTRAPVAETLDVRLAGALEDAARKFQVACRVRQATGYEHQSDNTVDGNFPLRMHYGQLREEIRRLEREQAADDSLAEDDLERLNLKQDTFNRSYEKVVQYALDHGISMPTLSTSTSGDESDSLNTEGVTITGKMESVSDVRRITPRVAEATPTTANTELTAPTSSVAAGNEAMPESEVGLSHETKKSLLGRLAEQKSDIEASRNMLGDTVVDSHPAYIEFSKRMHKLQSLLEGDWSEADSIVTQLAQSEVPRINALYQKLKADLDSQQHALVDGRTPRAESKSEQTDNTSKAPVVGTDETQRHTNSWSSSKSRQSPDVASTTGLSESTIDADQGADSTSEKSAATFSALSPEDTQIGDTQHTPEHTLSNQEEAETATFFTSSAGRESVAETAIPHQDVRSESSFEQSTTVLGCEVPRAGVEGAVATLTLKDAVGRALLIADKQQSDQERQAVKAVWELLAFTRVDQGISDEQRQRLLALLPDLPALEPNAVPMEHAVWQSLETHIPAVSEKITSADAVSKSSWRQQGNRVLAGAIRAADVAAVHTYEPETQLPAAEESAVATTTTAARNVEHTPQETSESMPLVHKLLDTLLEEQELSFTFQSGSSIDTVSEAAWQVWKEHADVMEIDSPVSKTKFLSALWKVAETLEKQPAVYARVTEQMYISSGDIHDVSEDQTINLAPLFQQLEAPLKETAL